MSDQYEINELGTKDCWRMFRIIGELVEGFDELSSIGPAVTVYGSARLKEHEPLYGEIREITGRLAKTGFTIITGGGPGAMEAANRGAFEAGGTSIGLNISLTHEQHFNEFTTNSIKFHHFFARKVMLVKYATAFIIMPGGWGTLDEFSEVVTLIQTEKIKPFPVILFKSEYWQGLIDWFENQTLARGFISPEDMELIRICDDPDEVIDVVQSWYLRNELVGKRILRG